MKLPFTKSNVCAFCLSLLIFLAAAGSTRGQDKARLTGTVKDQSGGMMAGASVTLTNQGTNISRTTKTDGEGNYLFVLVDPGTYRLTIERTGFKKYVQSGITLEVNQNGRLDATLDLGQSAEVVEVKADVTQVDTSGAVLGKVENERRILDLPLVDRNTLQLGLLQAGVFATDPDDGSGNPFGVSGQRSESLTFLLDGADNNDFLGNNIVVNPNPDAVQEFKILTNNYDAQYGRTSGGIVNQVIKSGTNSLHGSVFEFFRNDVLNARDFFLPERTSFKRNLFGASGGGPIKKDKLFFFAAYQGTRRREGQVAPSLTVLSPAERSGDFKELCPPDPVTNQTFDAGGNCVSSIGTQLINPATSSPYSFNQVTPNAIVKTYIDKYLPPPNQSGNRFISAPVGQLGDDQGILHLDYRLSNRDSLSFLYVITDYGDKLPFHINKGASTGGDVPVGSGFTDRRRNQIGTINWTHTFGTNWINEFRSAANRVAEAQAFPLDNTTPQQLGFNNVSPDDTKGAAPPLMFVNGAFNLGPSPQGPTQLNRTTYQWEDNVTVTHGHHEIRFGGDVRKVQNNFYFDFFNNGSFFFGDFGSFTGNNLADFVGGFPDNFFQFSTATYGIRTGSYTLFGQDTWKIHPRFTINFGVRYEYNTPQTDVHNNIFGYFPGKQSTLFPAAPPSILYAGDPGTPNRALEFPDKNNFAPRVGFAWDIFGNAKLVMRGGYGIFYDIEDGGLNLQFGGQPPFGAVVNSFPGPADFANGDVITDPFTPLGQLNPFPFASRGFVGTFFDPKISFAFLVDPHFRTPYSENFNYGFQYQLTKDTVVEAVYVGSLGRKLISTGEVNFPVASVELQQILNSGGAADLPTAINNGGFFNADCARPLGGCADPTDPNNNFHDASQLLTNFSSGISASHEFQLTVDKRFNHGFTLRGAYTLSKTTDMSSGFRSRSAQFTNPTNPRQDHALADFDATHRLVISGVWEIPFDRPFRNSGSGFVKRFAQGWQLNAIVSFQSGQPFTLYSNNNSSGQNNFLDRPDLLGKIQYLSPRDQKPTFTGNPGSGAGSCLSGTATGNFWFYPMPFNCASQLAFDNSGNQFFDPNGVPQFTFGTLGRNTLRGPGINNWDLGISKRTKLTEKTSLEFRAEFFNAWNHAQFLNPDSNGFSSTFGQVSQTRGPRLVQFALKLYY